MRIAFFSDNFYPEISGIADSIIILGKELVKRGHTIAYVSPHYVKKNYDVAHRKPLKEELPQFQIKEIFSLPYPGAPTGQGRMAIPLGFSKKFIREFKPDIIHTSSPFGVGIEALRVSKKYKIPLVGTNHTPIEEFMRYSPINSRFALWCAHGFFTWYYNHCRFISTPSYDLAQNMEKNGLRIPHEVIPNPLELHDFKKPTPEEKASLKKEFNFNGPVIIYSGRLATEKHIDTTLHAISKIIGEFPTLTFIITGHGTAEPYLRKLVIDLKLDKNVLFTGFVDKDKLVKLYQAADFFVIMSTAETQSIALMQAFATGIPALGSEIGAFIQYITPECGFRLQHDDVSGLASHMKLLLTDRTLCEKMGNAALSFVQNLSTKQIAEKWETIYNSTIHTQS